MWTRKIELFLIKIQSKLILAFEAIRADSLIRLFMEFSQKKIKFQRTFLTKSEPWKKIMVSQRNQLHKVSMKKDFAISCQLSIH